MDGYAIAVANKAKHHLQRLHLDDRDRHDVGSEEELVKLEAAGRSIVRGQEGLLVQLCWFNGVSVIETTASGYGRDEHIRTQIEVMQSCWQLWPRIDGNVGSLRSNGVEERVVAEPEQLDSRGARRRRERVEKPAGSVVEADCHPDSGRLAGSDPPRGQQGAFYGKLKLSRRGGEVLSSRCETKGAPARLGELRSCPALGFGKTMARCGWAQVERSSCVAKAAELTDGGEQLKV